jgi:hypothetical protein
MSIQKIMHILNIPGTQEIKAMLADEELIWLLEGGGNSQQLLLTTRQSCRHLIHAF